MNEDATIAILGAGITGLSAAYALKKKGIAVAVYEKKRTPGGVIQSGRQNNWLVEKGPNTMLVHEQAIWDMLTDLQLTNHIQNPESEAKKRYVVRNGDPIAVPTSIFDFFKTDLLSTIAKFRLLKEPFISSSGNEDENIANFIKRRLGPEVLDYAVNPFVSGIYAGDPAKLSLKHTFRSLFEMDQQYGSISRGILNRTKKKETTKRALISFDEGLHLLPKTLAKQLTSSLTCHTEIKTILNRAGGWELCLQSGTKKYTRKHKAIISTIPPYQLPKTWAADKSQKLVQKLSTILYAPMSVLALGFRRSQIQHPLDGFGMLIPQKEPYSLLGCLFSSSLFSHRAPNDHVLLTCFIGGARNPELAKLPFQTLLAKVLPQLNTLLDIKGDPVFSDHTFWSHAIPQFKVGFDRYLHAMDQLESLHPGFFLAGNYRGGVSVPDCILNGFKMAKRISKFSHSNSSQ